MQKLSSFKTCLAGTPSDFLALRESEEFSQQQVETPVAENVALRELVKSFTE